jgi:hypothetical protein
MSALWLKKMAPSPLSSSSVSGHHLLFFRGSLPPPHFLLHSSFATDTSLLSSRGVLARVAAMAMEKVDAEDREKIEAVRKVMRKQAPHQAGTIHRALLPSSLSADSHACL